MPNASRETFLRDAPPRPSRVRDLVIVSSMAIVSVAFGAGLLVNGGFGFGPSIIGGLGLFVLSMLIHTMMRRLQSLSSHAHDESDAGQPEEEDAEASIALHPDSQVSGGTANGKPGAFEDDVAHGWGEPESVNDLVRQLATELQKSPEQQPAPTSRAQPARPMPMPAEPLGSDLPPPGLERAPQRPMPPRAPAPPAAAREDITEVLRRAVSAEDIEIHLQPVMTLADRRTQLYEAFPRVRDGHGGLIRPDTYQRPAAVAGLLADIDRVAFRRTVQILGRLIERGKQRPMFTPLAADALRDGTFLRAFHETLKAGPAFAANLIFELPESDLGRLGPSERDAIHALANAGFRFSLQDVVQLDMGLIGDLPIAFVKLLPIAISGQPGHAAGLVARVRSIGAEPVVDNVQDEREIAVAQALGIVLGQGGFLSEPRPLKADVVGEARTGT